MEAIGFIEIKITGLRGNLELSHDNYDIREIKFILENTEKLLFPNLVKDRPTLSYKIGEGSVKHIFKTAIQYIVNFNTLLGNIKETGNTDFLNANTAKALENFQNSAIRHNYGFSFKTSLLNTNELIIDKTTRYYRSEEIWVDAESYFYGKITNAGGKDSANIHLLTEEFGIIRIQTPIYFLEQYNENLLYKTFVVRVACKQHSETGNIDLSTLKFIALMDYQQEYDEQYLKGLRDKAKKSWIGSIDPDAWLKKLRGGYDA